MTILIISKITGTKLGIWLIHLINYPMKNIDQIIEKLTLNRTSLLIKRFDEELKQIIENDLQAFKGSNSAVKKVNKKAA